jgi:8-oxo-dGTP pyrophosphatase MutT (NUDIX family)
MSNKKHMYCSNCGHNTHDYKDCSEPITSWGIILVNLSMVPIEIVHNKINIKSHIYNINPTTPDDLNILSHTMNCLKFLLVQRKHSIGYFDFIRGRYRIDNIDGINFLFQHMNQNEIKNIGTKSFDELWTEMWNNDETKLNNLKKEFINAKNKFEILKNNKDIEINLDFYIDNVQPIYKSNEWGFPKGRRSKFENPKDCALREFVEETNIPKEKIKIIDSIEPIEENLIGTNGIKYRHIYYIAEIHEDFLPDVTGNNEIGGINYFCYNDALEIIRDYHIEKKEVLTSVYYYYLETLLNSINSDVNSDVNSDINSDINSDVNNDINININSDINNKNLEILS